MTVTVTILTFGASAQQFPAGTGRYLRAEPLRSNTHPSFVGISTVTNDGSGTGVIKEIATPPAATVGLDAFVLEDMSGYNRIESPQFYGHGFSGEKIKVTLIA